MDKKFKDSNWILKSYRPTNITQKEYADFLEVELKAIQNWESRGSGRTTNKLLHRIWEIKIYSEYLEQLLKENNIQIELPFK